MIMENDEREENVLDKADLSNGAMHPVDPNIGRLQEPLEENMVIRTYCSNCGSYPEYGQDGAEQLANIGKFELPSKDEIRDYYISINTCPVCKKETVPVIELKKIV